MATYFVSKSGNNSNAGTSYGASYLTISKALSVVANSDSIVVGSGFYNERLAMPAVTPITLYADGNVVVDGSGTIGLLVSTVSSKSFSFIPYSNGGIWTFQNGSGTQIFDGSGGVGSNTYTFQNCIFLSNSNSYAFSFIAYGGPYTWKSCVFAGFTGAAIYFAQNNQIQQFILTGNTFYNCPYALYDGGSNETLTVAINQNIFSTGTTALYFNSAFTSAQINNDDYDGFTHLLRTPTSTYNTLAAVQALGFEAAGMTTSPAFVDTTNLVLYPTVNLNPNMTIGAYGFGYTRGDAYNPTSDWKIDNTNTNAGWANPDGNVTLSGSNQFQLASGNLGVIWSPVINFGFVTAISNIDIQAVQVWPTAGASNGAMVDSSNNLNPNIQTAECRVSNSSFAQNDGTIPWTTFYVGQSPALTGQYVQVRLTLNNQVSGT